MWVFTKHGFFSAVCARQGSGRQHEPVDLDRIMVRARVRQHLEALMQHFPELLGSSEIQQFDGSDYAFRIFIAKSTWAQVMSRLAEETDYDNFKSAVARDQGQVGLDYESSLKDVWQVTHRLQR